MKKELNLKTKENWK